jgi:hypothetical protein
VDRQILTEEHIPEGSLLADNTRADMVDGKYDLVRYVVPDDKPSPQRKRVARKRAAKLSRRKNRRHP